MSSLCQAIGAKHSRDAEVHDLYRAGVGQHHVRGLDVAVDYSHLVSVIDSFKRHAKQFNCLVASHCALRSYHVIQRPATHEFHHHEKVFALAEETMQRSYVGMIQFRERHSFGAKPLDDVRLPRQLGPEHLDGDLAFEHQVDALKDRAHTTFADFVDDLIVANYAAYHLATSYQDLNDGAPLRYSLSGYCCNRTERADLLRRQGLWAV